LLLLSRRTSLLGALILAGSLTNVLALNLAYGIGRAAQCHRVPADGADMIAPDAHRLIGTLFQPPGPAAPAPAPAGAWRGITRATAAVKWLVVIWLIGVRVHQPWVMSADEWRIPALYGIYDVEEFVRGELPWRRMTTRAGSGSSLPSSRRRRFQSTNGSLQRYSFRVDAPAHTLTLTPAQDKGEP
jgi:hypothetical protein